ncbi:ABC transporter ATP-binding protein [Kibdelosporangium phytohabitans]|uniref:ABC transporter n=1 Tax=Kibdelosporangium phytohabitans TaxID=860235 RepID=A0A0N9I014_9PSEU|nr:ABC transporter ATP-binding protein [Kibdelosporangium phytohabitans]ALG09344.1 ABC transporter [Kibdelosporangium phytohabitans]MBE1469392.1 ATP-binding cassette subfamily B protein [Kibdelosporangium phytohabitans]
MITDLRLLLGPGRAHILTGYVAWTVLFGVLSGLASALLVPVVADLASGQRADLLPLAVVTVVAAVVRYVQTTRGSAAALETMSSMHQRLGDHVVSLPLGWFDSDRTGRLTRVATDGTVMITGIFAHLLSPLVISVAAPVTAAVALFWYDWRIGLVAALSMPVLALAFRFAAQTLARGEARNHAADVEAGARVIEFARSQRVLRAFGRAVHGYQPLEQAIEQQRRIRRRTLGQGVVGLSVGGLTVQLAVTVLMLVLVWLTLAGSIAPAAAVALIALVFRFAGPLADVSEYAGAIRIAGGDLRRLTDVLRQPAMPQPRASAPLDQPGRIELDNVTFGYRPDTPVLRSVSLTVPPGSVTALVGPSGSGKTTVIRLISRFWDTRQGAVRVGGADVRDLRTEDLTSQLAVVSQDVYLFDDTMAANIRLGRPDATDADLAEAARLAGVDEIVARLPDGWHTRVGEGGTALSGGERQRVSIARALLKRAPIVLLDEATAALDPENERYVQRSIRQLAQHSTVLLIAHRLGNVVDADQIVVLDDGRVVETGTHQSLVAADGPYAKLWRAMANGRGWRLNAPQ